jgi:hypothetical protein
MLAGMTPYLTRDSHLQQSQSKGQRGVPNTHVSCVDGRKTAGTADRPTSRFWVDLQFCLFVYQETLLGLAS